MIGVVSRDAGKRIYAICGEKPDIITIDRDGIRHALRKTEHHLKPEDLLLAVDAINTSEIIDPSDRKHSDNVVLTFEKDIGGEITFLTEVHIRRGDLLVFNAWRRKKRGTVPMLSEDPPGLTSKT